MATVAAIGSTHELEGFALAGVPVHRAATQDDVVRAWACLDPDVGLVILSPDAADVLASRLDERPDTLVAVMP